MIVTAPVGRIENASVDVRYDAGGKGQPTVIVHLQNGEMTALGARALAALLITGAEYAERKERP